MRSTSTSAGRTATWLTTPEPILCQILDRSSTASSGDVRTVPPVEISKLFGLPAHPLLVHVPIVLIPLVSVGAIALVAVPAWRPRFGWVLAGLAAIALVGVQLAIGSGEGLQEHVEKSEFLDRHVEMADSLRPLALVLLALIVALVLVDRYRRRPSEPRAETARKAMPFVAALLVLVSVGSTVRLAQIGHNGAKASWHEVNMDKASEREGGEGGEQGEGG